jgi:DNA invertase Pin-like site-specific DNA recombinase
MIAAIYARVSTRDKGQEPENQLRELRAYCQRQGWTVYQEYIDQASAKSGERDRFSSLFADAFQRRFDVVVTWALDRFTREGVLRTFKYLEDLKMNGVMFESFTEPHFRTTGPAGELMLAVSAWIARQERERIAARVRAGLERARGEGKTLGRPRAIFDREKAARLHRDGYSWRQVASALGKNPETVKSVMREWRKEG